MSDNLILDFPILKEDGGDFVEGISYEVEANQVGKELRIQHTLKGQSFISRLVINDEAKFSVLLLYKDSSERQHHLYDTEIPTNSHEHEIVAKQTIPIEFSYAPEIMPSIVIFKDKKIISNSSSGLTNFWKPNQEFHIPSYSRIALGSKLKFTAGDTSSLMKLVPDEKLGDGEMEVKVNENAGEGETPVSLHCGQGVYDELKKVTSAGPSNPVESVRSAIITQALCAIYAYMQNLNNDYEINGVLAAHLDMLEEKTNSSWQDDEFNPSLAATKMHPYAIKALSSKAE